MLSSRDFFKPRRLTLADFFVFLVLAAVILGVVATAQRWSDVFQREVKIDLGVSSLLGYSLLSLTRGMIAYLISLSLAILFGWLAARSEFWERLILPALDIGQSLPVLGFLPGLVLGLMAIFPTYNIGLELACILMIVTSQLWNMAFSFYASLKNIPPEFYEVAKISQLGGLARFAKIDLPFSATPLAWNSLVSIAGGWFFLTICESFQLQGKAFRLPGLGSYMSEALNQGNASAILMGIGAMMTVIVLLDFLIWRPIISWSQKFRPDDQPINEIDIPFVSLLYKQSRIADWVSGWMRTLRLRLRKYEAKTEEYSTKLKQLPIALTQDAHKNSAGGRLLLRLRRSALVLFVIYLIVWVCGKIYLLILPLSWAEWGFILKGAFFTLGRISIALVIATAWTLPVGVFIGLSPRLTRFFQPVIQVFASFPSPMVFPLVFLAFNRIGVKLGIASIFLLVVGIQWYILFNVLAGSIQIAQQHRDSFRLMEINWKDHWKKLYLPSVFPYLVTGWITAAGAAWNASIVTEYLEYNGKSYSTDGIGSIITLATGTGNFSLLGGALIVMVTIVIMLNRSFWKFLFRYAETRFTLEA